MVFTLAADTEPEILTPEDLLSGRGYEVYARMLFLELFEQEQVLVPLLLSGYAPDFAPIRREHVALDGSFDQAHGRLRLEMSADMAFLYTVQFFRNQQLVTTAVLTGRLRGGCS